MWEYVDELYHYGVKGQKWGVRRYQNADGTLTKEGKKKAKQEYKADNATAFELGKQGTIYGHAMAKSAKRTNKLINKVEKQLEKDPYAFNKKTQSLARKLKASSEATKELLDRYIDLADAGEKHCKSLVEKYGKQAVTEIKYKDVKIGNTKRRYSSTTKVMNEATNKASDYAKAGAMTLTSSAISGLMGAPFSIIYVPATKGQIASRIEKQVYREKRKEINY